MEQKGIKRLPVLRGDTLIGIVTRANLLQAVANLFRGAPQPTAGDDELRRQILTAMEKQPWCPMGLNVVVRDGIADLNGIITDDRQRNAAVVAAKNVPGVKEVYDHLCWVDTMSGTYIDPREEELARHRENNAAVCSSRLSLPSPFVATAIAIEPRGGFRLVAVISTSSWLEQVRWAGALVDEVAAKCRRWHAACHTMEIST